MRLNIKKEQRFENSGEVKKFLRDQGVGYEEAWTDEGKVIYADIDRATHIKFKEGRVGKATNYYLVRALSMAGLLLLLALCLASQFLLIPA